MLQGNMVKLLVPFILTTQVCTGQIIDNPSFEGLPKNSQSPPGWHACNDFSTPDTQPGSWNVAQGASNGKTYVSLVTRGLNGEGQKDNSREAIGTTFKKDLTIGVTYEISVDLAFADYFDDFWYTPIWNPVVLKVYAGDNECTRTTLIWVSSEISNTAWTTYNFDFTPTQPYKALILEAGPVDEVPYNGNILVDNIKITDGQDNPPSPHDETLIASKACKLGVPNVFTPNSDAFNEKFTIQYASNVARFNLRIYNRWGKLVFESSNINTVWDGRTGSGSEASIGVYYWIISCLCIDNNAVLDDNLRGTVLLSR
jgi:gliding motility-associated-like protein